MEFEKHRTLDFVLAPNLLDHQFRIADHFQGAGTILQSVLKSSQQPAVFSVVVRLVAKIFAEFGDFAARLVLDDDAIARRYRRPSDYREERTAFRTIRPAMKRYRESRTS
jgi:hypothetical protein